MKNVLVKFGILVCLSFSSILNAETPISFEVDRVAIANIFTDGMGNYNVGSFREELFDNPMYSVIDVSTMGVLWAVPMASMI